MCVWKNIQHPYIFKLRILSLIDWWNKIGLFSSDFGLTAFELISDCSKMVDSLEPIIIIMVERILPIWDLKLPDFRLFKACSFFFEAFSGYSWDHMGNLSSRRCKICAGFDHGIILCSCDFPSYLSHTCVTSKMFGVFSLAACGRCFATNVRRSRGVSFARSYWRAGTRSTKVFFLPGGTSFYVAVIFPLA